ncbi:hypothetical protein ATN83_3175 [Raoultella ornithinolytica]|nr:hypothetical protein ATN83_3175 [Raoultella ornithinolytica]KDV93646.1 hypothetical protein AB00_1790 [Raoultella ornithinolytica 2-156-04_S1_C1]KDX13878.1 hypothetical protein AB28_1981 [Raoultella ornithinolytica 2-156-04_S1_C2]
MDAIKNADLTRYSWRSCTVRKQSYHSRGNALNDTTLLLIMK